MRQGEIMGLKWDSVDFDNKKIYVQRAIKRDNKEGYKLKDLKNNSSYRSISITDSTLYELKKHMNKQKEIKLKAGEGYDDQRYVVATTLGTFVLPTNLGRAFRLLLKKADVKNIRFHDLRHTRLFIIYEKRTP